MGQTQYNKARLASTWAQSEVKRRRKQQTFEFGSELGIEENEIIV
jgi:hypothetical protein